MLTPKHRALFAAAYAAPLLRVADDEPPPPAAEPPSEPTPSSTDASGSEPRPPR